MCSRERARRRKRRGRAMSIFSASIAGTPGSVTGASHAIDGASVDGADDTDADADTADPDVTGMTTARVGATARLGSLRRLVRPALTLAIAVAVTVVLRVSGTLIHISEPTRPY